jgi:hypothetical protein
MRHLVRSLTLFSLLISMPGLTNPGYSEQVKKFIDAFNSHDSKLMSQYVTDDVQWLSIDGDMISVETNGKAALIKAMNGYFSSCSACQSKLLETNLLGSRVSTIEQVSWQRNGETHAQRSLAIYEFTGTLIRRVYYFPAE